MRALPWFQGDAEPASSGTAGTVLPPAAETRKMGTLIPGVNRITPPRFHVPPRPPGASQIVSGGPLEASIFFSFPAAKNPMTRPSGDQKGKPAPSVPSRDRAFIESTGRTHNSTFPSEIVAA